MSNMKMPRPLNDCVNAFYGAALSGLILFVVLPPQKANSTQCSDAIVSADLERAQFSACLFDAKCKLSEFKVKPINPGSKTKKGLIPPVEVEVNPIKKHR